jgi:hypothetical protein
MTGMFARKYDKKTWQNDLKNRNKIITRRILEGMILRKTCKNDNKKNLEGIITTTWQE